MVVQGKILEWKSQGEGLPICTFTVDHEAALATVGDSTNSRAPRPLPKESYA